jgi:hypothetical protein
MLICLFSLYLPLNKVYSLPPLNTAFAGLAWLVQLLDMGWRVRGSNSTSDKIIRTRPDRP